MFSGSIIFQQTTLFQQYDWLTLHDQEENAI
jgi:hypothetical protein